jgi:protein TonB
VTGIPALDGAARRALLAWRFNRLPTDAPQENQTGIITFRFTVGG